MIIIELYESYKFLKTVTVGPLCTTTNERFR